MDQRGFNWLGIVSFVVVLLVVIVDALVLVLFFKVPPL